MLSALTAFLFVLPSILFVAWVARRVDERIKMFEQRMLIQDEIIKQIKAYIREFNQEIQEILRKTEQK